MHYLDLLKKAETDGVSVHEFEFKDNLKGLYLDNHIAISKNIDTTTEKKCILAEELGHHHTNSGNILNQNTIKNSQQEHRGRAWGIELLVSLEDIIDSRKKGIRNSAELAEELDVTEDYLLESLMYYKSKYGLTIWVGNYLLNLDTLEVIECIANNEFSLHKYIKEFKENNIK